MNLQELFAETMEAHKAAMLKWVQTTPGVADTLMDADATITMDFEDVVRPTLVIASSRGVHRFPMYVAILDGNAGSLQ